MSNEALCKNLLAATYAVEVYENQEDLNSLQNYSAGSAVCINENGDLLTAAHVILGNSNRMHTAKLTGQEIIIARTQNTPWGRYAVSLCGISIEMKNVFRNPLYLDLAYLKPFTSVSKRQYFPVKFGPSSLGEKILMAGFPKEADSPFGFHRHLDLSNPAYSKPEHQTPRKLKDMKCRLLIKSGIIGVSDDASFNIMNSSDPFLATCYYVDNAMHDGASGGPVINLQGELVATITMRALTTVSHLELEDPNIDIPSGATIAISSYSILNYIKKNKFLNA